MRKINGAPTDDAPVFNIKAVVTQTGLNPATIRAWERRYGFPLPHRTAGGHRQYTPRDIEALKWLMARQEEGVSISHAIEMWHAYVEEGQDPLQPVGTTVATSETGLALIQEGGQIDELRRAWVAACLAFDRDAAERVLATAFARFNPETVCIELLQKGLAEVGNAWYRGEVTVQQEHFTSALSVQRLEMLIAASALPTRRERIIVATAPGDYHVFSPLLLTFLLRRRGWGVIYLGAAVPAEELDSTIDQVEPELVIISAQLLHTAAAVKEVAVIAHSHNVTLAFGGMVFNRIPKLRQLIPGHFLGESLEDAIRWVSDSIKGRPPAPEWEEPADVYQGALTEYTVHRALIEAQVWDMFTAANRPVEHLASMNNDLALTIEAALKLGDVDLIKDINWIEYLLMGYRLSDKMVADYVSAYYQAANSHLSGPARIVVNWLSRIAPDSGE